VQLVEAAHAYTQEMMEMMHCSSEHYTKMYIVALSSLAEEYAEWKASSWPSIPKKSPSNMSSLPPCEVNETHKVKGEVPPPPCNIEANVCKRETPSCQGTSSPTTHGDNGVCQVETTPMKREEVLEPPHIEYIPVTDVMNAPDPHEDQQPQLNESSYTPIHEMENLSTSQGQSEASQASNNNGTCQDTLLTVRNEKPLADQGFDQLGVHDSGVFKHLTNQEVDETKFICKGKQSQPPDINSSIKSSTRRSKHTHQRGRNTPYTIKTSRNFIPQQQNLALGEFLPPSTKGK